MRFLLAALLMLSCTHVKTTTEVERGYKNCIKVCKLGDQFVQSYQFDTGECTCSEPPPKPTISTF